MRNIVENLVLSEKEALRGLVGQILFWTRKRRTTRRNTDFFFGFSVRIRQSVKSVYRTPLNPRELKRRKDSLVNKLITRSSYGLNKLWVGRVYLDLAAQAIDHVLEHRAVQFLFIAPNTPV